MAITLTHLLASVLGGNPGIDAVGTPAFLAYAAINDPLSHGLVGDGLLSLNEAIRLHNGTLQQSQLSAAEAAQVALIPGTGTSPFLSWARCNPAITPVITIERDLDVVVDTAQGFLLSSDNGQTVLDFTAGGWRGLVAASNSLQLRDLVFRCGTVGVDVLQTDVGAGIGLELTNCRFENQTQFGVRLAGLTTDAAGRFHAENCVFANCANGILIDDPVAGRTTSLDLHDCRITGVLGNGLAVTFGNGGFARVTIDRVVVEAGGHGLYLMRPNTATRTVHLLFRHVEVRAPTGAWIEGSPSAPTLVRMQMLHLRSTSPNGHALRLCQLGDLCGGVVEDSTFRGNVLLTGDGMPLLAANLRMRDGSLLLSAPAPQGISLSDTRCDNAVVTTGGLSAIRATNCCFANCTIHAAAAAPLDCADCHLPGQWNHVTTVSPRAQEQLGSMDVLPDAPTIGGAVVLRANLPAGLHGVFLLGLTEPDPQLLPQPLHVYGKTLATWLLPGIYTGQQAYTWLIPNVPAYRGLDCTAQIAVLPNPGVSALPVQLPPGRRFALQ